MSKLRLSPSSIELFDKCPYAYKLRYIRKQKGERGPALLLGTLAHECIEAVYRHLVRIEHCGSVDSGLVSKICTDVCGNSPQSSLSMKLDATRFTTDHFARRGSVDHLSVVAVERRFELEEETFEVVGVIDLVERTDNDGLVLTDYKSSSHLYTDEDLAVSVQAGIYLAASSKIWPWAKTIDFSFDMLRFGETQPVINPTELASLAVAHVKAACAAISKSREADLFPARLNTFCAWCDYVHQCETFATALRSKDDIVAQATKLLADNDLAAFVSLRDKASAVEMHSKRQRQGIDKMLRRKIKEADGDLYVGGKRYSIARLQPRSVAGRAVIDECTRILSSDVDAAKLVGDACQVDLKALSKFLSGTVEDTNKRKLLLARLQVIAKSKDRSAGFISSSSSPST